MGRDTTIGVLGAAWTLEVGASINPQTAGSHSMQGGASFGSFPSQSIFGGASVGTFLAQSINGGGSVSGVPCGFNQSGSGANTNNEGIGLWLKYPSFPASDMTLLDFDAGPTGYYRLKLSSNGKVTTEWAYNGTTLTNTPNVVLAFGVWNWISACVVTPNNSTAESIMRIAVTQPGGIVTNPGDVAVTGAGTNSTLASCRFGVGVSVSSAYLAFPNSSGWEISKVFTLHGNGSTVSNVVSAPTADITAGGYDMLFMCRGSLGAFSTLSDTSGNSNNLSVGAQGGTIVADGPYAS